MKFCLQLLTFSLSVVFCTSTILAEDWPAFRGPRGNGTSLEKKVPLKWSPTENIIWKVALPAPGNSSPIVSNGRVVLSPAQKMKDANGASTALTAQNGRELWKRTVNFDKVMPTHKTNNYCGSTPVADGKRVVVWHASAGLFCYDFAGKELWNRNLGEFEHIWGYGASPILHKGKIILHCGPGKRVFMTAIDLENGKTIWETEEPVEGNGQRNNERKYMGSWSTPIITKKNGQHLIICSMSLRVNAYDPQTGKIIWELSGATR